MEICGASVIAQSLPSATTTKLTIKLMSKINPTLKFAIIGVLLGFATGIIFGTLSAVITLILK